MAKAEFHAPDIECDGCAATIRRVLGNEPGVTSVSVDVPEKNVRVEHDEKTTTEQLAAVLTRIGFPPGEPARS